MAQGTGEQLLHAVTNQAIEIARLQELQRLEILDTEPEQHFDDITSLAADLLQSPISLISLIDEHRQWFKSATGLTCRETRRDISFCTRAIERPSEVLVIPDATKDERFCTSPLVTGPPHIRAYVGVPLVTSSGIAIGTLCVIDQRPRSFDQKEMRTLTVLARQAIAQMELRKLLLNLQEADQTQKTLIADLTSMKRRLDMALDGTEAGLWDWNVQTGEVTLNERWSEMIGYRLDELKPLSIQTWARFCHPDDLAISNAKVQEHLDGKSPSYKCTVRMIHRDGSERIVLDHGRIYEWDAAGKPLRMAGTHVDITASELMRTQIHRAEKLELAGTVAGQVAHDFNNLLSPMTAYPIEIKELLPEDHPALQFVEIIEESARKMAEINQQLLTLSRRAHYKIAPVRLDFLVRELMQDIAVTAPSTLVIEFQLTCPEPIVEGGESQLYRACMNIMQNARDAMQDRGTLTIGLGQVTFASPARVYSGIAPAGDYLSLSFADTGSGIAPELLPRVLEPYVTRKSGDNKRGSGLGLSVVASVVQDHNGFLDIASEVGAGTVFTILLPPAKIETPGSGKADKKAARRRHVLVVDDDQMVREVARRLLIRIGFAVTAVASGEAAIDVSRDQAFDLMLIDLKMDPGIDGTETFQQVLAIHPRQRAIMFSGYTQSDRLEMAMSLGASGFLQKPFDLSTLGEAVSAAFEAREVETQLEG